ILGFGRIPLGCAVLIVLIILVDAHSVLAQSSKKGKSSSSKEFKISKRMDVQSSIFLLLDEARTNYKTDPQSSFDNIEEALNLSLKSGDKMGEASSYKLFGDLNFENKQYDLAIKNYNKAEDIFRKTRKTDSVSQIAYNLARAYERNGNAKRAQNKYQSYLNYATKLGNVADQVKANIGIASYYNNQGEHQRALDFYRKALSLEEERDNKLGIVAANDSIAKVLLQLNQDDEALELYQTNSVISNTIPDKEVRNRSLDNIGNVYRSQGLVKEELDVRQQSLDANEAEDNEAGAAADKLKIGELLLENEAPEEAITYFEDVATSSGDESLLEEKATAFKSLAKAFEKKKDYTNALLNYQSYVALNDSIQTLKSQSAQNFTFTQNSLLQAQSRVDLLEKDQQLNDKTIELLKQQEARQRLINYALLGVLIIVSVAAYIIYKNARQRRIANQLLALRSLRTQMNPHFIFNALNSVNSFIANQDEKLANKYLSDFSKLMRMVMENSKHDLVSLSTEIEILKLYLSLEHFRFKEKFDYEFVVDEEIDIDSYEIPPMLIQPYIENAVWHGLRYKQEKGRLYVGLKQEGADLNITVEDDGIGRKKSFELKTKNQKEQRSTGLKNIENRIQLINELLKTKLKVIIEDLKPEGDTGTRVAITIPQKSSE
ncbi:MAG: tetratricopeptide repeat protein, partial [Bacteroidota bacterium]